MSPFLSMYPHRKTGLNRSILLFLWMAPAASFVILGRPVMQRPNESPYKPVGAGSSCCKRSTFWATCCGEQRTQGRSTLRSNSFAAWACNTRKMRLRVATALRMTGDSPKEIRFPHVIQRVFKSIDTTQMGTLSTDDLLDAVDTICLGISYIDAHKVREDFLTVDGTMTYDEFVEALFASSPKLDVDAMEMAVLLEDAVLTGDEEYVADVYDIFKRSKKSPYKDMDRPVRKIQPED